MILSTAKTLLLTLICIPILSLIVIDILVEDQIQPQYINFGERPPFEGALEKNNFLSQSERTFENEIVGPESMVAKNGIIYSGTADGKIVRIQDGKIHIITELGVKPCGTYETEPTCGRPLGMRFDQDGYLIVADTYLGVFRVNVTTGEATLLISPNLVINGFPSKFLNDLDIASDGTMYISDSCRHWDRREFRKCIIEAAPDGRLLRYDPKTKEVIELASGFGFANGVQLDKEENSIFLVESATYSISRYYIKGSKTGQLEKFMENLPGLPDNIRPSSSGGYWIGLASVRNPNHYPWLEMISRRPALKRLVNKIMNVEKMLFGTQDLWMKLSGKYGMIIEINEEGEIMSSLHDPTAEKVVGVSEISDVDGILYLGSYHSPYLVKLDTNKLK